VTLTESGSGDLKGWKFL